MCSTCLVLVSLRQPQQHSHSSEFNARLTVQRLYTQSRKLEWQHAAKNPRDGSRGPGPGPGASSHPLFLGKRASEPAKSRADASQSHQTNKHVKPQQLLQSCLHMPTECTTLSRTRFMHLSHSSRMSWHHAFCQEHRSAAKCKSGQAEQKRGTACPPSISARLQLRLQPQISTWPPNAEHLAQQECPTWFYTLKPSPTQVTMFAQAMPSQAKEAAIHHEDLPRRVVLVVFLWRLPRGRRLSRLSSRLRRSRLRLRLS